MTRLHRHDQRALAGSTLAASACLLFLACAGPTSTTTQPAGATSPPATTSSSSATPPALAFPTRIEIPDMLAHAIGATRASTERGCPHHQATAWAAIDEAGTVQGTHAECVAGP